MKTNRDPSADLAIVTGIRTPFCKAGGALKGASAADLATHVFRELLDRTPIDPRNVDEVILGCAGPDAREANIAPADVDLMLTGMRTPGPESAVKVGSPWLLDLMNRPANAVKGAVVEAGGTPFTDPIDYVTGTAARGAWRGLSGKENYAGTQGLLALGGVEKKKGQEIRESLPGPVRVAL